MRDKRTNFSCNRVLNFSSLFILFSTVLPLELHYTDRSNHPPSNMSQPEGRALTLTELRHLYHPHLADEGSRERAVVVVDNSSHEDEVNCFLLLPASWIKKDVTDEHYRTKSMRIVFHPSVKNWKLSSTTRG
jgi:hypothetical protein